MSQFEALWKAIWTDPKFQRLSKEPALLYIWAFSNLRSNMAGLYPCSQADMAESKVEPPMIPGALQELHDTGFMRFEDDVVWVVAKIKRLPTKGPKIGSRIGKDVALIDARHPLRDALIRYYAVDRGAEYGWLTPYLSPLDVTDMGTVPSPENDPSDKSSPARDGTVGLGWVKDVERTAPLGLTYQGRSVPQPTAELAARLLDEFNRAAGRTLGTPSHLRQIAGAIIARPDVTAEEWESAVRNTVRNPPSFVNGPVQLGHIFGEKAADHALANDGKPTNKDGTATAESVMPSRSTCLDCETPIDRGIRCRPCVLAQEERLTGERAA